MDKLKMIHEGLCEFAEYLSDGEFIPVYSELIQDEKGEWFISFLAGAFEIRVEDGQNNIYMPESAFSHSPIFKSVNYSLIRDMAKYWAEVKEYTKPVPTPEEIHHDAWAANADSDDGGY